MYAYVMKEPHGTAWNIETAKKQLSSSVNTDDVSCHFERLPEGVTEHAFFNAGGYISLWISAPVDEEGLPYVGHGIIAVVFPDKIALLTETEAVIRGYGAIQFELGRVKGAEGGPPPPESSISPSGKILKHF